MTAAHPSSPAPLPSRPRRRPLRLWPLLFLPVVGGLGGLIVGARSPSGPSESFAIQLLEYATLGLAAGSFLMMLVALGFIVARLAVRQFTIRSILIAVAVLALMLGLVRACLP